MRDDSPGRLGDVPADGPSTSYSVEAMTHSPFALSSVAWEEWKEAFLHDLREEERFSDLIETFQRCELEREAMEEWAATL
jgi:hypothetical protein